MLLSAISKWNECDVCYSTDLIYGYRMFSNEEIIKIEVECNQCKRIYFKYVNGKEYEEIKKLDKGMDKEEGKDTS